MVVSIFGIQKNHPPIQNVSTVNWLAYQMGLSSPEATFQHHHAAESVAFEGSFDTTLEIRKQ